MKLSTSLIVSLITLLIGLIFSKSLIFIPVSVAIASVIDLFTRQWVMSNELGRMRNLSALLKLIFSMIGFYGTIGQFVCIGLLIKWFIF